MFIALLLNPFILLVPVGIRGCFFSEEIGDEHFDNLCILRKTCRLQSPPKVQRGNHLAVEQHLNGLHTTTINRESQRCEVFTEPGVARAKESLDALVVPVLACSMQ